MKYVINNPEDLELLSEFSQNDRHYVIFRFLDMKDLFLYFRHTREPLYSLFFGSFTETQIAEIRKTNPKECIECRLGVDIKGGISQEDQSVASFGLDSGEANHILQILQNRMKIPIDFPHFSRDEK